MTDPHADLGLDPRSDGDPFDALFREDLLTLFKMRRDVRRFRETEVPEPLVLDLLQIANMAPSVGLSQPWRFFLVDDRERRAKIKACFETCNKEALASQSSERAGLYARLKLAGLDVAPCQIAVYAETAPRQGHGLGRLTMPETIAYSVVMAIHTLWLAARAHGIGLGWVSILDPKSVNAVLEPPETWQFIGYFCLGYPIEEDEVPELEKNGWEHRRPIDTFIVRR